MPRNAEKNREIRDARREQILDAALHVFARRGMAATKISDIAKEAKLSHGLVYHYFQSKEEIFTTLVRTASSSSIEGINAVNTLQASPLEKLRFLTQSIIESIQNNNSALLFLIMIQASTSDAVPEEVKEILSGEKSISPVKATIALIIEGQQKEEIIDGDPITLAVTYYAFIQGLAINKIQWDECPMPTADIVLNVFKRNHS